MAHYKHLCTRYIPGTQNLYKYSSVDTQHTSLQPATASTDTTAQAGVGRPLTELFSPTKGVPAHQTTPHAQANTNKPSHTVTSGSPTSTQMFRYFFSVPRASYPQVFHMERTFVQKVAHLKAQKRHHCPKLVTRLKRIVPSVAHTLRRFLTNHPTAVS